MKIQGIQNGNQSFSGIHVSPTIPSNIREVIVDNKVFRDNAGKYDISFDRFIVENCGSEQEGMARRKGKEVEPHLTMYA